MKIKKLNITLEPRTPMSPQGPVIFVDDDIDDQYFFEEVCKELKLSNDRKFFNHSSQVLAYLRATVDKPFIIFCDINMPEMDGIQLRKQINAEEYLRRKSIPFIFFSTAATEEQVRIAYDLTVQGFFLKEHYFADSVATIKLIFDYWRKCKHPNTLKRF